MSYATPTTAIPVRASTVPATCLDLSAHYHHALVDDIHHKPGNTLGDLPCGFHRIAGVDWDLRGVVQLGAAHSKEITGLDYPKEVRGIVVNQAVRCVHFLHASAWDIEAPKGPIGDYVLNKASGASVALTLVYRENLWDWWALPGEHSTQTAWSGQNVRTRERGTGIRLFHTAWELPEAGVFSTLDLVSRLAGPAPMLVAVTVE